MSIAIRSGEPNIGTHRFDSRFVNVVAAVGGPVVASRAALAAELEESLQMLVMTYMC